MLCSAGKLKGINVWTTSSIWQVDLINKFTTVNYGKPLQANHYLLLLGLYDRMWCFRNTLAYWILQSTKDLLNFLASGSLDRKWNKTRQSSKTSNHRMTIARMPDCVPWVVVDFITCNALNYDISKITCTVCPLLELHVSCVTSSAFKMR